MLNSADLLDDYNALLEFANRTDVQGKHKTVFRCVETLCHWLYHTNLKFSAPELELLVKKSIDRLGFQEVMFEESKGRVVFVDFFGWDNKGLTQQYLSALISSNVDFIYVQLNADRRFFRSEIYKCLRENGCEILLVRQSMALHEKIQILYEAISLNSPRYLIFHTSPWDVVSTAMCFLFPGAIKLNINLTDHAFWLGAGVFDYIINFRAYGARVASEERGIPENRQFLVPMYPILPESYSAVPALEKVKADGKVVLISGGAIYKILDENMTFLNLIASVLLSNKDAVMFFLGGGDSSEVKEFIEQRNLTGRFYLLPENPEIYSFLKASDIYVGTFPVGGGLMTQLCSSAGLPFVALKKVADVEEKILSIFPERPGYKVLFSDFDECRNEILRLISDVAYRSKRAEDFSNCMPRKESFVQAFTSILNDNELSPAIREEGMGGGNGKVNLDALLEARQDVKKYYLIPLRHMRFALLKFRLSFFARALLAMFGRVAS